MRNILRNSNFPKTEKSVLPVFVIWISKKANLFSFIFFTFNLIFSSNALHANNKSSKYLKWGILKMSSRNIRGLLNWPKSPWLAWLTQVLSITLLCSPLISQQCLQLCIIEQSTNSKLFFLKCKIPDFGQLLAFLNIVCVPNFKFWFLMCQHFLDFDKHNIRKVGNTDE